MIKDFLYAELITRLKCVLLGIGLLNLQGIASFYVGTIPSEEYTNAGNVRYLTDALDLQAYAEYYDSLIDDDSASFSQQPSQSEEGEEWLEFLSPEWGGKKALTEKSPPVVQPSLKRPASQVLADKRPLKRIKTGKFAYPRFKTSQFKNFYVTVMEKENPIEYLNESIKLVFNSIATTKDAYPDLNSKHWKTLSCSIKVLLCETVKREDGKLIHTDSEHEKWLMPLLFENNNNIFHNLTFPTNRVTNRLKAIINRLQLMGLNINQKNDEGQTPIHSIAKITLEPLPSKEDDNYLPAKRYYASLYIRCNQFYEYGADLSIRNRDSLTVVQVLVNGLLVNSDRLDVNALRPYKAFMGVVKKDYPLLLNDLANNDDTLLAVLFEKKILR